jgi:Uma2 family endonuclease
VQDVIRLVDGDEKRLVELVNGTLVEKPVGLRESVVSIRLATRLSYVIDPEKLGYISGEAGMIRMLMGNVRVPDLAFFRTQDLPGGRLPREAAPIIAPALAVEILSDSNTDDEMRMKLNEYFESGIKIVWILDPELQTVRIYDAPERFRQLTREDNLDGGNLVPGFSVRVGDLFDI